MDVVILGSGTALHRPHRTSASLALWPAGLEHPVLVDLGSGSLLRMAQAGIRFELVRDVYITHIHPDHHGDLVPMLFGKNIPNLAPNAPLTLTGGPGFADLVGALSAIYGKWIGGEAWGLQIRETRAEQTIEHARFSVRTGRVNHIPSSLAYRFEDADGRSLVVSGDTGESDDLAELARGVDALVLECSHGDHEALDNHLTPSRCGRIAAAAGARSLILTHFYPGTDALPLADLVREAGYEGPVIVGGDLVRIAVTDAGARVTARPRDSDLVTGGVR